jgi:glutamyl-tRNA reductase
VQPEADEDWGTPWRKDDWSPEMPLSRSADGAEIEATVASLKQHLEAVRQREVKRMRRRLGQLDSAQENVIESLTHSLVDQILETPISVLKAVSSDNNSNRVIETVRRIFSLESTQIFPWQRAHGVES